jgi:hypothetical protein
MSKMMLYRTNEAFCEVSETRRLDQLGFGDGRGFHERTVADYSIRHHAQVSFKTSFMLDATLLVCLESQ